MIVVKATTADGKIRRMKFASGTKIEVDEIPDDGASSDGIHFQYPQCRSFGGATKLNPILDFFDNDGMALRIRGGNKTSGSYFTVVRDGDILKISYKLKRRINSHTRYERHTGSILLEDLRTIIKIETEQKVFKYSIRSFNDLLKSFFGIASDPYSLSPDPRYANDPRFKKGGLDAMTVEIIYDNCINQ